MLNRYDFGVGQRRAPLLDERFERLLRRQVDLVDHHQRRHSALADAVDDLGRTFVVPLDGVGHVEQHVGVRQGTAHEIHHRLLQLVTGFQDARRIGEDAFISVDFPTLGFPMILTKPDLCMKCGLLGFKVTINSRKFLMFAKVTRLNRIAYGEITGDISGCRCSFLRKSRADGRIESIFMCRHRTKSAGTKHIKAHRLFFLHSELGHF